MTVQRVSKPIRMRVRRTCHRCQTTFGPDKVCVNCQHARCKKCPRHPAPKSKPDQPELGIRARIPEKKTKDVPVVLRKAREELTLPSRTGGQDLVRRPIRQRIRRTCHECEAFFPTPDATECINCRHIRCRKCPRDPYVLTHIREYTNMKGSILTTQTQITQIPRRIPRRCRTAHRNAPTNMAKTPPASPVHLPPMREYVSIWRTTLFQLWSGKGAIDYTRSVR